MSIDRDKDGHFVFECDYCGDNEGGYSKDFTEAWEVAKDEGYRYQPSADKHICGLCNEAY